MSALILALVLTVVGLAAVVWSGVTARRRTHYALVLAMLGTLGWAIAEAEAVGRGLRFEGSAHVVQLIHFAGVAVTFLLLLAMVVSGVRLHIQEHADRRRLHARLARAFLLAVVLTCALGTAMTWLAQPLSATAGG